MSALAVMAGVLVVSPAADCIVLKKVYQKK